MIWAVEEFLLQKHDELCEMSNDNAQHLYSSGKTVHFWFKFPTPSAQMTVKCRWEMPVGLWVSLRRGRRLKLQIDWRITRLNKRELSYHDLKQDFPFVISCYV